VSPQQAAYHIILQQVITRRRINWILQSPGGAPGLLHPFQWTNGTKKMSKHTMIHYIIYTLFNYLLYAPQILFVSLPIVFD